MTAAGTGSRRGHPERRLDALVYNEELPGPDAFEPAVEGSTQISSDRYDPLPELHRVPAWLWRRASLGARIAFVAALLLAAGTAVVLVPGIRESKREQAQREAAELRAGKAQRTRALRAEQRVLRGSAQAAPPADTARGVRIAARERVVAEVRARILADARARRLSGRLRRVQCARFPRSPDAIDPRRDLRVRSGRYGCLVVTADIPPSETNRAGVIGHPYRALIDFRTGRYAYCKISGVPGEGAFSAERPVTVPKACGGI